MGAALLPAGPVRPAGPGEKLAERDLAYLWYEIAFARRALRTRCGRHVRVLYRGIPNGSSGPDYRAAVLTLGRGRPRTGDIELHVRASQWRDHGHHQDPAYNHVILHVVWQDDDPSPTILSGGGQAPVLSIREALGHPGGPTLGPEPCRASRAGVAQLGRALDRAGDARFLAKAARMEGDMAVFPEAEVLYQSLAEALGYSANKAPFRRLAVSLPLSTIEGFLWAVPAGRRETRAQALLLGAAGLLPVERGLMKAGDWRLGVRPGNHPVRRIEAMASLLASTIGDGLVQWARSAGMGNDGEGKMFLAGIGRDRALEIVVNVVLPFTYAYGQVRGDEALSQAALDRYGLVPAPAYNQVTRHMRSQVFGISGGPRTARQHQGLLHLFHSYCSRARCSDCELSQ